MARQKDARLSNDVLTAHRKWLPDRVMRARKGYKVKDGFDSGSAVPRRQLGRELRRLRMEAGLTMEAAAQAIGRSAPTLWRMEKGGSPMRPGDVAGMCRVYGADDRTTEALMALATETRSRGWWRSYHGAIPKWFDTYIGLEQAASELRVYNASEIPGLLQTRPYAETTFHADRPVVSDKEREEKVTLRLKRQALLTRRTPPAPQLDVVLGEAVLLRSLADQTAMAEQLRRILDEGRLPNVTVRVLLLANSLACTPDARFTLLTFPPDRRRQPEPPVAYVESLTGALYLSEPAEIDSYNQVWEAISAAALSEDDSLKMISTQIERYQQQ
ncbi:MAG: helix-turn-helix domain-containing protein [Micromonosporaceae bacterium]|nr:helix-turn-helix domain-containing protein [Micromonosporaceae bacterium]